MLYRLEFQYFNKNSNETSSIRMSRTMDILTEYDSIDMKDYRKKILNNENKRHINNGNTYQKYFTDVKYNDLTYVSYFYRINNIS